MLLKGLDIVHIVFVAVIFSKQNKDFPKHTLSESFVSFQKL